MEWTDEGLVLAARPYGENAAIVSLLTCERGRHAGLVHGGQGASKQSLLQPGNLVKAQWRARLLDQLGTYTLDLLTPHAAAWLDTPEILAIIASACAVTEAALPERQSMPGVYAGLEALFSLPTPDLWGPVYVKWEMGLLKALGYGLDLERCAVTGETEGLSHVSPRTGRAVSRAAALPYGKKLLILPGFLRGERTWDAASLLQGLELTGHFLARHVFANPHGGAIPEQTPALPPARQRLADYYRSRSRGADE